MSKNNDQKEKDFWHFLTLFGFDTFFLPAYFGLFGNNAQKGAEETAEVMGAAFVLILILTIIGGTIWAVGHFLFGVW